MSVMKVIQEAIVIKVVKSENGKCHSSTKEIWKQNCYHINITICVRFQGTLLVPGLSYINQVVPKIFLIL